MRFKSQFMPIMALAIATTSAPAAHADWLMTLTDPDTYIDMSGEGMVDACNQAWVLDYIKNRFDGKVRAHLNGKLFITDIEHVSQTRAQPRDDEHLVGRQYCQARVTMTDQNVRTIYYSLEYPWSFAGQLTHVEFCIPGMDPTHVYGRQCSTVR